MSDFVATTPAARNMLQDFGLAGDKQAVREFADAPKLMRREQMKKRQKRVKKAAEETKKLTDETADLTIVVPPLEFSKIGDWDDHWRNEPYVDGQYAHIGASANPEEARDFAQTVRVGPPEVAFFNLTNPEDLKKCNDLLAMTYPERHPRILLEKQMDPSELKAPSMYLAYRKVYYSKAALRFGKTLDPDEKPVVEAP